MNNPTARVSLATGLVAAWLALLLWGYALGGAVHLLLASALVLFPWRSLRDTSPAGDGGADAPGSARGGDAQRR